MAIIDVLAQFADKVSVASGFNVGSAVLGDVMDLGAMTSKINANSSAALYRNEGNGKPMKLEVDVVTDLLASGGASTVEFKLVSAPTADLTTNGGTLWTSGAIAKASLVAGYKMAAFLPDVATYQRYLGIVATVASNNLTAGTVSASLRRDVSDTTAYPSGIADPART